MHIFSVNLKNRRAMNKISLIIGLLAIVSVCNAQQGRVVTYEEALEITMTANPQIKANTYEHEAIQRERKAAYGLRLPQVGVTGAYTYMSDDIAFDLNGLKDPISGILGGLGGSLPPSILEQAGAMLAKDWSLKLQDRSVGIVAANVTIPIYTGGKINAANNAAKIKVAESTQSGMQSRNALISELTERYYGLALAIQVADVRKAVVEGMKHHLADAKAMEQSGLIARSERLYAEVHAAEAEREYIKAAKLVETLRSALSSTLNSEESYTPITNMFILSDMNNVEWFKEQALASSPLLKQVSLKKDLAQEGVRLSRSEFLPQVALMGMASLYDYQLTPVAPRWAVGAGVSLKIFDGLHREYKHGAARSTVKQVEALGEKASSNILTLIDKLYNEMSTYNSQMPSIDAALVFAEEYLRIKEEAFKEGVAPATDVIDAELNLAKVRVERLQAAYYFDCMLARLLEASGISETFAEYSRKPEAIQIRYEK